MVFFFFFQAEDGIRYGTVTGVQTCALPISVATSTTTPTTFGLFENKQLAWKGTGQPGQRPPVFPGCNVLRSKGIREESHARLGGERRVRRVGRRGPGGTSGGAGLAVPSARGRTLSPRVPTDRHARGCGRRTARCLRGAARGTRSLRRAGQSRGMVETCDGACGTRSGPEPEAAGRSASGTRRAWIGAPR